MDELVLEEELVSMLLAILVGGLIGAEREYRSKSAGLRTMILVCLGSCLFTILSRILEAGTGEARIISNIVVGIGFLGAGVIFKENNKINGITTASTVWVVAALGMALGGGFYKGALLAAGAVLMILGLLMVLERQIEKINQFRDYRLVFSASDKEIQQIESIFKKFHLKPFLRNKKMEAGKVSCTWKVQGRQNRHEEIFEHFLKNDHILAAESNITA